MTAFVTPPEGVTLVDTFKGRSGVLDIRDGLEGELVDVCLCPGASIVLFEAAYHPDTDLSKGRPTQGVEPLPVCPFEHGCCACNVPEKATAILRERGV